MVFFLQVAEHHLILKTKFSIILAFYKNDDALLIKLQ